MSDGDQVAMAELAALQRRLTDVLWQPLAGASRAFADLADAPVAAPDSVGADLRGAVRLTADEGWELYRRQAWLRVIDSIVEDVPVLGALLGASALRTHVEGFVRSAPPRSRAMLELGVGLPTFLAGAGAVPRWAADVATIELARLAVADAVAAPALTPSQLAVETIALQPTVRLCTVRCAAAATWRAWHRGEAVAAAALRPTRAQHVAVVRVAGGVDVVELGAVSFHVLAALGVGRTLAHACAIATRRCRHRRTIDADLACLTTDVATWLRGGWLTTATPSTTISPEAS